MLRFARTVMALVFAACVFAALPSEAAEVAVVDVARVIDSSTPGKEGQKYIDDLKARLETELENYRKSVEKDKDAQTKTAQKQAELNAQFRGEYARVTNLVTAEMKKIIDDWLKTNSKKGYTVVIPKQSTISVAASADISREILRKMNAVKIDFAKK